MIQQNPVLGIIFKLTNLALFTMVSLLWAGCGLGTSQEMFIVCGVASILLTVGVWLTPGAHFTKTLWWSYALRALTGLAGMWTWIEAIKTIAPNLATAFSYATPFFCLIAARVFFREKLNPLLFVAFALCVLGALLALVPHINSPFVMKGVLLSIISACCWAGYNSLCKLQANHGQHFLVQALYTFGFSAVLIAPVAFIQWQPVPITAMLQLTGVSALRIANIVALFFAYKLASLSLLAPFEFARIIFMGIASYLLWNTIPMPLDWLGAGLIFSANVMLLRSSAKETLDQKIQPSI